MLTSPTYTAVSARDTPAHKAGYAAFSPWEPMANPYRKDSPQATLFEDGWYRAYTHYEEDHQRRSEHRREYPISG